MLALIRKQMKKSGGRPIDAIILVGGFASSQYLFSRVQEEFGSTVSTIARPVDCEVATLQGACRYGLSLTGGRPAVSSVISPRCTATCEVCLHANNALQVYACVLHLARSVAIAHSIATAYIMKVKLPAESQDFLQRPGYINVNDSGVEVCENRL